MQQNCHGSAAKHVNSTLHMDLLMHCSKVLWQSVHSNEKLFGFEGYGQNHRSTSLWFPL